MAPIQIVIIPIVKNEEEANSIKLYLNPIIKSLNQLGIRIYEDWSSNSPGFKFNEWEMKGVPLRMEIGPRDMASNQVVIARRDNKEKLKLPKENIGEKTSNLLDEIHNELFNQAKKFRNENNHR